LKDHTARDAGGTAGFVMATGELSNSEIARLAVRRALVDGGFVDCIVTLTGKLFANTQIPCALIFLSKNRGGGHGFRARQGEVLFIDGRKLGTLIPGSRKQKQLTLEELERVAAVYRKFRRIGIPDPVPGFTRVATLNEIAGHRYVLTPGRYTGSADEDGDDEPFEERYPRLSERLKTQFREGAMLAQVIESNLSMIVNGN
jgi:type I restriction enzyme M protein